FHGVEVKDGVAFLYKAVDEDFRSMYGTNYAPGAEPQAPDWDGGDAECGGGLHFSPKPAIALRFQPEAAHFVACPVRLEDIVLHDRPLYAEKVKAKGVCGPVFEVD